MAKLTALRARLGGVRPRVGRIEGDRAGCDRERDQRAARKLYHTARWKALRMATFERDLFTCQCGCGRIEGDTSRLVADHRRPHRGDLALFWDLANLQTLLKPCHDSWKQRQETRDA